MTSAGTFKHYKTHMNGEYCFSVSIEIALINFDRNIQNLNDKKVVEGEEEVEKEVTKRFQRIKTSTFRLFCFQFDFQF